MDSSPLLSLFILLTFSCIPPLYSDPSARPSTSTSASTSTPIPSPSPPAPPSQASFSPLRPSIVIIVTILTALFGITFILLLYAKHCSHDGGSPGGYPGSLSAPAVGRKNSGIDRTVVESLPVFRFSSLKGNKEGLECVVCLARFEPTETLRLLPKCGHAFHVECVDTWLDAHSTCPLCRNRVDPEDILIPGRDVIIPISNDDQEENPSAPASASTPGAAAGGIRRVSGRHSYAGERARAFGDSIRSKFAFRRSLDGNGAATSRKDGLLRTAADGGEVDGLRGGKSKADRKVEHRIVVSDGKGGSDDVQTSDMLYLETRSMMSEGSHGMGGRSLREEEGRIAAINGRSTSAMSGLDRRLRTESPSGSMGPPAGE
ncbi:hypothetical protein MLD38_015161 [Melastoma candidum]|uniref:Uncharacterized protein n=1 Tax=Melastoma candidum TaxID=119954 RepID=A0ACB9RFS9_9MYRT|nr:hypothetical protein MLD38_015161 [Melastoma candidum]